MNDNSLDSSVLDEMQMFYARAFQSQALGLEEVRGAPAMQSDASGKDFAHPSCPNFSDFSEIRSWSVQPSNSFWRNSRPDNEMQAVELREDVENHSAVPEVEFSNSGQFTGTAVLLFARTVSDAWVTLPQ